ncbi:MAG: hypothetical protein HS104_00030 [Polyangiaceae bacterium]|nr:hypothetical protein [Polyangiaceae bacterium]
MPVPPTVGGSYCSSRFVPRCGSECVRKVDGLPVGICTLVVLLLPS